MIRAIRPSFARLFCALFFAPALSLSPALALDITGIDLLWLHDRLDGTPVAPNPYGMEAVVFVGDTVGMTSMRLVTPTATHGLSPIGGGEWEASLFFANTTDLFTALPQTGTYTFEFLNGAAVIDSYSIVLGPGDINEVTDFLAITSPSDGGSLPLNGTIDWTCGLCDGTLSEVDVVNLATDDEVDRFTGPPTSGSFNPSGLVVGQVYETEAILSDYFDNDAPLETTANLDPFQAFVGYESINLITWTATAAVPEPGTALLLASGLLGLASVGRPRGRKS